MQPGDEDSGWLLHVPNSWMFRLFTGPYLDSDSKLSLFRSCSFFYEPALRHSNSISLSLDLLSTAPLRAYKMLQRASRHARSIKLRLFHEPDSEGGSWEDDYKDLPVEMRLMQHSICGFLEAAGAQGATSTVTTLLLERARFNAIIPTSVGQACPHLTKLVLTKWHIAWDPEAAVSSVSLPQLQSLEFKGVEFGGVGEAGAAMNLLHLQAQLSKLTALQSLTVSEPRGAPAGSLLRFAPRQVFASLAGQLTHLCLDVPADDGAYTHHGAWYLKYPVMEWVQLCTRLQHLQLPNMTLKDGCMRTLLNMPQLTHVQVRRITLRESFAAQPCTWEQLTIDCVDFAVLAHLPLHSGLLLKVQSSTDARTDFHMAIPSIEPDSADRFHKALVQKACANARQCRDIIWDQARMWVVDLHNQRADRLEQALLLMKGVKALGVIDADVRMVAMQALCRFAGNSQGSLDLLFECECDLDTEGLCCLIKSMPHGSTLELHLGGDNTLQLVTRLCCAATCKLRLHIHSCTCLPHGYMQHVKSAMMHLRGHENVELCTSYCRSCRRL